MISYPPNASRSIGNEAVTSAGYSTASALALPANPDRAPGSFIINYSNKIAYVTQNGQPAVAGRPATPIPASGGVLQLSNQAAVNIIFASGGTVTTTAEVHEFSYV
jgi:hypothetical protein